MPGLLENLGRRAMMRAIEDARANLDAAATPDMASPLHYIEEAHRVLGQLLRDAGARGHAPPDPAVAELADDVDATRDP